jgi:hypothetical protein
MSYIGKSKEHRKIVVKDQQGNSKNILWWNCADSSVPDGLFDLAYYVRRDDYHSKDEVMLEWVDFREIETSTVELRPEIKKFNIHDFRKASNQEEVLEKLANTPDVQLWSEGIKLQKFHTCNRLEIKKSNALAILNSPPNRDVLSEIIKKAVPTDLYLLNLSSVDDSIKTFQTRLIGLINYCLSKKEGKASLEQLSAALGQSNKTIELGLELLKEKGEIDFRLLGTDIELSRLNKPENPKSRGIENKLIKQLQETSAFRSYYQRTDPNYLLGGF